MPDWPVVIREAMTLLGRGDPEVVTLLGRTLQISLAATACAAVIGLPVAAAVAAARPRVRRAVVPMLRLSAMVPAVLIGLLVAMALGEEGAEKQVWRVGTPIAVGVGQGLLASLIVASVAEPVIREVRARLLKTAWTLGASAELTWWVLAAEARSGLMGAVAAALARVLGEVGSALVLGGTGATVAAAIATHAQNQSWSRAVALGMVLSTLALLAGAVRVRLQEDAC